MGFFVFTVAFRLCLEPTQSPMQWIPGALTPLVKQPGHDTDHSPPSSTKVQKLWNYTSTLVINLHDVVLKSKEIHLYSMVLR
jgi:hypothetical protein